MVPGDARGGVRHRPPDTLFRLGVVPGEVPEVVDPVRPAEGELRRNRREGIEVRVDVREDGDVRALTAAALPSPGGSARTVRFLAEYSRTRSMKMSSSYRRSTRVPSK